MRLILWGESSFLKPKKQLNDNCQNIDKEPISWAERKTQMWRQIQTAAKI